MKDLWRRKAEVVLCRPVNIYYRALKNATKVAFIAMIDLQNARAAKKKEP